MSCWWGLNANGELDVVLVDQIGVTKAIGGLNIGVYAEIERNNHNSEGYTKAKAHRGHKHQKCELELTNTFEKSAVARRDEVGWVYE